MSNLPSPALRFAALFALALLGCEHEDDCPCPSRAEPARALAFAAPNDAFEAVILTGWVDADITLRRPFAVRTACDGERAARVTFVREGDALRLETNDEGDRDDDCAVKIELPDLKTLEIRGSGDAAVHGPTRALARVDVHGSGDASIDELAGEEVALATAGSGDIAVRHAEAGKLLVRTAGSGDVKIDGGRASEVDVSVVASGDVSLGAVVAEVANVSVAASGDVDVTATKAARVDAMGSGDVTIGGNPVARAVRVHGSSDVAFR